MTVAARFLAILLLAFACWAVVGIVAGVAIWWWL